MTQQVNGRTGSRAQAILMPSKELLRLGPDWAETDQERGQMRTATAVMTTFWGASVVGAV